MFTKMENIRRALPEDCKDVYALICEMEESELPYGEFEWIFKAQAADERYVCLVCLDGGETVGCINLRMERQLHHAARICEIMELAVAGGSRSKGLGRRLFDAACEEAKAAGCVQIEVCCNQLRMRAHHFYEKCGMNNFHYKFSLDFTAKGKYGNRLGR